MRKEDGRFLPQKRRPQHRAENRGKTVSQRPSLAFAPARKEDEDDRGEREARHDRDRRRELWRDAESQQDKPVPQHRRNARRRSHCPGR